MVETSKQRKRPTRNFAEYFWILKNKHNYYPDVCIDVGAGYGTATMYGAFKRSHHVCFEPLEEHHADLKKALNGLKHDVVPAGALDKPGKMTISLPSNLLEASMAGKGGTGQARSIDITTVDDVVKSLNVKGSILLKTDCQGTDILALKGAQATLEHCDVVIVEAPFFKYWGGDQADFFEIVYFMKSLGFVVHDLLDGLFRPCDRALGQIDIAFVREFGRFREKSTWW